MKRLAGLLFVVLLLYFANCAFANNARDYLPLPADTVSLNMYLDIKSGNDCYQDSELVTKDMDMNSFVSLIRPIYYTQIGNTIVAPQLILPVGKVEVNDEMSSGIGDLQLAFAIFAINDTKNKFVFGYTPYLTIPTGEYDRERSVNLGDNRWATKQEIALVKGFGENTWLEWYNSVEFFFDNSDASGDNNKKVTSSKDAQYNSEVHLSYTLTKSLFTSLDYYFSYGGETENDGCDQNDTIKTHTAGISLFFMLNDCTQATIDYRQDLDVETGIKSNGLLFRFSYLF